MELQNHFVNKNFITVLIPLYNGIEFLEEAINSIKKQTFKNWNILIGVNGYEENSEIFKKASLYQDEKIKVLDLYNFRGKSNTLNEMLKYTENDWICLLDADDKWLPEKLEKQIKYIDKYDVIGTKCKYFGSKVYQGIPNIPKGDLSYFNFKKFNPIINSSVLMKKELCNWDPYYDSVEDYELWLRLKKNNYKFYNIDIILTFHRIHEKSFYNNNPKQKKILKELKNKF